MPLKVVDGDNYSQPDTIEPLCDWPIILNCAPSTPFDPAILELAKESAAEIMNAATAYRFGVCTSTFSPLAPPPCEVGHISGWSLVDPRLRTSYGADRFRQWDDPPRPASCACVDSGTRLRLWHTRVVDVTAVIIDGVLLDPSAYYLDGNILVRDDGSAWPSVENTAARNTTGSWEITYRHGVPVSNAGAVATGVLACEIAMALSDDESCSLPERTKTYTNHAGLTIGFIDPMNFLADGLTGLYVPDQWITRENPHRIHRRARAYSFKKQRRHGRRITLPPLVTGWENVYTGDVNETIQVKLTGVDDLTGVTAIEAHVWDPLIEPNVVTTLAATVVDAAERIVEIELGGPGGWLPTLTQDPGQIVYYNVQVEATFGATVSTWPPDVLTVIGQAA